MTHVTVAAVMSGVLLVQAPARSPSQGRPTVSTQAQQRPTATDSMRAARDSELVRAERAYREILEKTNNQLGLWTNPYGIMIGVLGVLFAVGAIVVGVLIWRQGQDYRRLITDSISEYQRILNTFVEEKNKQIEILKASVGEKIDILSKEMIAASGAQKKELESHIQQLEQLRKDLKPQGPPKTFHTPLSPANLATSLGFGGPFPSTTTLLGLGKLYTGKEYTCSRCHTVFRAQLPGLLGPSTVTCPNCGQLNPA